MKQKISRRVFALLLTAALSLVLAVTAWAATSGSALNVSIVHDTEFKTNDQTNFTLQLGGNIGTLTVQVNGGNVNVNDYTFTWQIDDDSIAEFAAGSSGSSVNVRALAEGDATVTVKVEAKYPPAPNNPATGSAVFKFKVVPIPVDYITISTYSKELPLVLDKKGQTTRLSANVGQQNATDKTVTWKVVSDDEKESEEEGKKVATVDSDGTVTAVGTGRAIIIAKAGEKEARCAVEVSGVVLDTSSLDLLLGGKSVTPTFQAYGSANPQQGSAANHYWQTSDPLVAAVNRITGTITPRGVGEADITFTYVVDGDPYDVPSIHVTVTENDESIHHDTAIAGAPYLISEIMPQLNAICRDMTDGGSLSYISNVSVPTREGVLYYNHVSDDDTGFGVGATERYYYDENTVGERYLSGLTFVPNSDFNGETTITFTGYASNKQTYNGKIRLTVTGSGNVTFITKAGEALNFTSAGFSAACRSETGREVDWVSFTLPDADKGLFCYGYSGGDYRYTVTAGEEYFRSRAPYIDQVSFLPAEYYIGTMTLPFRGQDTAGISFNGKLYIIVVPNRPDGERKELTTTAPRGTTVDFDKFNFQSACQAALGESLSYVRFTPPPSSTGLLCYNYTSSGRYDSLVNANTRYYPSRTPRLDDLTFVPDGDRLQPVTIDFVGYGTSGRSFDGMVTIYYRDSSSSGDVITYAATSGQAIPFEPADFSALCQDLTGKELSRIEFAYLPESFEGTLFRNFNTSSSTGTKVTTKDKIYRSSLSGVAFAPRSDFVGTVELEFNGYASDSTRFTGTVRINVEEGNTTLRYSTSSGSSVNFSAEDFNTICQRSTDGKLNYVRFTLPPTSQGRLYYRYNSSSTSRGTVSAGSSYYYSTSGSNKLDNVYFTAAANYTGTVSIDYTGFSTSGARFTGTVQIDVSYGRGTNLYYTSNSLPFHIPASEIISACTPLLDREFSYVTFNSLPSAVQGKLYYDYSGYGTGTAAATSTRYYQNRASYLDRLSFVPKEGFTGVVTLPYTAYDTRGSTVSGTVTIDVVQDTSSVFTDMGGHVWAIPSVDFLYDCGAVDGIGYGQYGPGGNIKRGDFVLLLHRMFHFRSSGTQSYADVPAGSYYAEAIAAARAQNVIPETSGMFRPEEAITRQDAMLYLRNAMRAAGMTVPTGSTSELYYFLDYASVSDQARSAVISMIHMGVVKGNDLRLLTPTSPISRAEMAVLIHRAMTL